ncbi:unnamed protein product [Polarella glacialis]|uniref:Uncharacterized protein n=1 Tax=Polarella glacialis TaxID=89957 RepID=A0A813LYN5_POLGL|nr:unnamed protein product [Polarella glacialis]
MPPLWSFLLVLVARPVGGSYFPEVDASTTWQAPLMQPWDPVRAQQTSITVAWTPAWNPYCTLNRYELQARRPAGAPLRFADLESLAFRETDPEDETWPGDQEWTPWMTSYTGVGRVYTLRVQALTPYAAQFRVRSCGAKTKAGDFPQCESCSAWSPIQTTHAVLSGAVDKINFIVRGTGMNAPDYTHIEVNRQVIYRRRDETGLVLAVFRRLDFSLQWLRTYDTHRNRSQALLMADHLRLYNASYFVVVASAIAWEWHAPRSLVQAMEFCGAFHFGQWAHIFAERMHYSSNSSDLQQTATQQEFGHPYAFMGIPGIGSGMGWESLAYNSGHYLAKDLKMQQAIIRGIAYLDYVARLYRLQDVIANKADFYLKSQPPAPETLHNPMPKWKQQKLDFLSIPGMTPAYTPYVGTLRNHITALSEANGTVPPHNYAFVLVTDAKVMKVDPRPASLWMTELERVWEGQSRRYFPNNGTRMLLGTRLVDMSCTDFIFHTHLFASPESCGANYTDCCNRIDVPGLMATQCGIGVSPTLCVNSTVTEIEKTNVTYIENRTHPAKWPYKFWVIDWLS